MLALLWLLSLSLPSLWAEILIRCSYKSLCQQALVSGNDVVLQCDYPQALWYFSPILGEDPFLISAVPNIKKLPGGSLQLTNPQPSQTGLYHCQDSDNALVVEYEIDFQDVSTLHITHKGLGQKPLQNETLSLGGRVLVFTHWEPWQDCNRCGEPGERKRLGYCYIEEPQEKAMPCWLYLRGEKTHSSRLRTELQVEACLAPCDHVKETNQPYFIFDIYPLGKLTNNMWLTCPLASIYRPILWEVNDIPLTWQGQLSNQVLSSILEPTNGGRQLQIFQPAIYKCFVKQELMARFNPRPFPDVPETLQQEETGPQLESREARKGKARSVLKGLKLMLLVGIFLGLLGLLLKLCHPSQHKRSDQVLLVK
ncbi:protein FAM187B isoform X2 [Mustela putorius furo]|uniref:Protein FAM187B isoform X2 n=1 Tax=Mustela putorius furo TaxID=9669 RepID=A0A8U0N214_MUSPF|nr:protein FAM187B isoform X2 [Mustela putorius furo]